jgi:glyoxylase-like metal-dependent hydrolase (beta-lactamase superfamily II)
MNMKINVVTDQNFAENCYIVWRENARECVVIDPGLEPHLIVDTIEQLGLEPVAILNTHGHLDHIAGNPELKRRFPNAPLIIGQGDAPMLTNPVLNLSAKYGFRFISPPADRTVTEGEILSVAGFDFQVYEISGHSPGHVVFYSSADQVVFGGDVLFQGSIGRTDFPGGSFEKLRDGIHQKLFGLADSTVVYPGHGPETTIGTEKNSNPFVGLRA